ncbi:MAG: response regulator [Candidatus Omnitrophota bacterium]|nr:response regulator [Candidatus Omnitrophota bacterium]
MPTALIIDPDPKLCEIIDETLREEIPGLIGYNAQNGTDGVRLANEHPFDLIILSLFLKTKMPADQIIQQIKSIRPNVRIIILSGSDFDLARAQDEATMQRLQELGWDAYLVKGNSELELINAVKKIFQEK